GVEDEAQLRRREVRVDHQAGARAYLLLEPAAAQRVTDRRGLARLPDDRRVDRPARAALPHHGRLALVGDADRGDVARLRARVRERAARGAQLRLEDLVGIVLDPARLREVLAELVLVERDHAALGVEQDRARRGRALVERHDVAGHTAPPSGRTRTRLLASW